MSQSPSTPAASSPWHGWLVAVTLLVAFGVRAWGAGFGLPYDLTADEPHQIVQALKVGAGEGGPLVRMWHTIGKGGLDYLLFAEYGVLFVVMWLAGQVAGPRDFALLYLQDPTWFYLVGRLTMAVLGALTCAAIYAVGRRLYGTSVGVAAAWIGAVAYFHAADSHVINVHIPMAAALWAGVLAYLRFEESGQRRWLGLTGVLCGAAIALAYTAAVGALVVAGALVSFGARRVQPRALAVQLAVLCLGALASILLMSPDLVTGAGLLVANFAGSPVGGAAGSADAPAVRGAIDAVTILRERDWLGYVRVLLEPHNAATSLLAVAGLMAGVWRRDRWTVLFGSGITALLVVLSASGRGLSESYLFPMLPAVWLMASRGLHVVSAGRTWLLVGGAAAVTAAPAYRIVGDDYMLTQPDTRVVAKRWIEANLPEGSTILMDGMRFRFVQGVPLNPDSATVERRLAGAGASELALPADTDVLYREAAARVTGPRYNLHSTMYGLEVESLDAYVARCIDYVVISSFNEKRYETPDARRQYPRSAAFYDGIRRDPRFRRVLSVEPVMWERVGPTITVYDVRCEA